MVTTYNRFRDLTGDSIIKEKEANELSENAYEKWKEANGAFMDRFLKEYLKDNLRIETTMYNDNHVYITTYLGDTLIQNDEYVY